MLTQWIAERCFPIWTSTSTAHDSLILFVAQAAKTWACTACTIWELQGRSGQVYSHLQLLATTSIDCSKERSERQGAPVLILRAAASFVHWDTLGHSFSFLYMCSSHTCSISALITNNHSTLHHLNQLSTGCLQHAGEPRSHTWMKKIRPLYYIVLWCRVHMCWEGAVPLIGFGIWQKWIDLVNSALQIQIGVAQPNWSLFILAHTPNHSEVSMEFNGSSCENATHPRLHQGIFVADNTGPWGQYWPARRPTTRSAINESWTVWTLQNYRSANFQRPHHSPYLSLSLLASASCCKLYEHYNILQFIVVLQWPWYGCLLEQITFLIRPTKRFLSKGNAELQKCRLKIGERWKWTINK